MFPELEICLKTYEIIKRTLCIIPAKLQHCIRLSARFWIGKSLWLKWSKAQRFLSPLRHNFNGHTSLKNLYVLHILVKRGTLGTYKCIIKSLILVLFHRTVYIVRRSFAVACSKICYTFINTLTCDNGCRRIKEKE